MGPARRRQGNLTAELGQFHAQGLLGTLQRHGGGDRADPVITSSRANPGSVPARRALALGHRRQPRSLRAGRTTCAAAFRVSSAPAKAAKASGSTGLPGSASGQGRVVNTR